MALLSGKCQLFIPEMYKGVLTAFIQAISLNRKRKARKITCVYPLEIEDLKTPDAFGIPIVSIPPVLWNSSSENPLLPSEFQKAVHRTVWIFSGIAHSSSPKITHPYSGAQTLSQIPEGDIGSLGISFYKINNQTKKRLTKI